MSPGKPKTWIVLSVLMVGAITALTTSATAQAKSPSANIIVPAPGPCFLPNGILDIACTLPTGKHEDPDIKRINREMATIESQTLAYVYSHNLDAAHQVQYLGELEVFDVNLSVNNNIACAFCHDPQAGFKSGVSLFNKYIAGANPGSVPITNGTQPDNRIAKRSPQTYSYATFAPRLHYNATVKSFYGGNFWDMRATGNHLMNPAAEQAQDPPTDPDEMANPDPACVVWKLSKSQYASLFEAVWGQGSLQISWPSNVAQVCSTPKGAAVFGTNATPLGLSPTERTKANSAYDHFGLSIATYEASPLVNSFTSKFDYYLAGAVTLTPKEQHGYDLFRGKAGCNACHLDGRSNPVPSKGEMDDGDATNVEPVFTDFTPNNIGLPKNYESMWYMESSPDQWGFTSNPMGYNFTDLGMGLFLNGYYGTVPNQSWIGLQSQVNGMFQTPTLRNVGKVPYRGFVKAYMHNGYLKSLKEVVHWYNTSQALPRCAQGSPGEKVTCWPEPEYPATLNKTQLGNLHLTPQEENDIVSFLETLTDGYTPNQ